MMSQKLKKALIGMFTLVHLLVTPVGGVAWAVEVPAAPSAPTAPSAPEVPDGTVSARETPPEAPDAPDAPVNNESVPEAPDAPSNPRDESGGLTEAGAAGESDGGKGATAENTNTGAGSENTAESTSKTNTGVYGNNQAEIDNDLVLQSDTGGNDSSKNTGDASITTGNANVVATVENQANQSGTILGGCASGCGGASAGAANTNTGADSENNAQSEVTDETLVVNNNFADLDTGVIALADTGHNEADKNTGNATIDTGDSNVGLTVVNMANTDITGVGTTEFNVYDDHRGDIVIDFSQVETGNEGGVDSSNEQTGADSTNNANASSGTALTIVNNNDAQVASELVVDATTGRNSADKNTGDATITTGDANVATNVVNLVNNAVVGGTEILVATVNIFGDLVGDIILAGLDGDNCGSGCGGGNLAAGNTKTGAGSDNQALASSNSSNETYQNNTAEIGSSVGVIANTGDNSASENTMGGSVQTGDVNAQVSETTVANNNMSGGGTWWLVIVNEAGEWVGKIFGNDDQGNIASGGTVSLGAVNESTGAGSENNAQSSVSNESVVVTNNTADVDSQVTIIADTGHNSADENTGSGSVATGDVNVMANVVNFVNNNFVGGKVFITFVNVFGSWVGDVVPPGYEKSSSTSASTSESDQVGDASQSLSSSDSNSNDSDDSRNENSNTESTEGTESAEESGSGQVASAAIGGAGGWWVNDVSDQLPGVWTVDEDDYLKTPVVAGMTNNGGGDGGSGFLGGLFDWQLPSWLVSREGMMTGWLLLSVPLLLATRLLKRRIEISWEIPAQGIGVGA